MSGSIIDAEKLQNEQFIKRDWLIYTDKEKISIIFDVTEKQIKDGVLHYNLIGKVQGIKYYYKPVKVNICEQ